MWFLASVETQASSGNLDPLYLLTGSIAAIVAVALSVRSIIKSMIERSKEEAVSKQEHNVALSQNTKAIEKLDTTTDKLARNLDKLTLDATIRMNDQDRRMDEHARRIERLESHGNIK